MVGFVDYDDPRMVGTADAIRADLNSGGLILRSWTRSARNWDPVEGHNRRCSQAVRIFELRGWTRESFPPG